MEVDVEAKFEPGPKTRALNFKSLRRASHFHFWHCGIFLLQGNHLNDWQPGTKVLVYVPSYSFLVLASKLKEK